MHRFYSKNPEDMRPVEEEGGGNSKDYQKSPMVESKISIAILWTPLLTPFCDSAHLGLGAHFSYCMKEKSEQSGLQM
jgi:hypothetical protein